MDLYKAIRSLYEEKKRLDRLIQSLERIQARGVVAPAEKPRSRRGRRSMSAEERREVSARMKRYWAARRASRQEAAPAAEPAAAGAAAAATGGSTGTSPAPPVL